MFLIPFYPVFAQGESLSMAKYAPISGSDIKPGSIISSGKAGYEITKTAYDPAMVGVVTENPAVAFELEDNTGAYPLISEGTSQVRVLTTNGEILQGDPITSSETEGVGVKAKKSGFILGQALEDYKGPGEGLIRVNIKIRPMTTVALGNKSSSESLSDILDVAALASGENPTAVFKYIIAGLIILSALLAIFLSFGRIATNGIRALGRNPTASTKIHFGIFLNITISFAILASSVLVAFLIFKF